MLDLSFVLNIGGAPLVTQSVVSLGLSALE